jgi:tRNA (guanine37-N1)-methyltransferase
VKIEILTLFPEMLEGPVRASILGRAREQGLVSIEAVNVRDFARDRHRTVDDRPFGGGPGMVMKCGPLVEAIEHLRSHAGGPARVVYMTPEGRRFDQAMARELSRLPHLIFVSGHYEGIDERVREGWVDDEVSLGDYVLTNGTLAALVVADAVVRLLPGALGNEASAPEDSFAGGLLEGPQYTRPEEFRGHRVPEILLGGNHAAIAEWRRAQALGRTRQRRPDLL